ncbi:MAG: hypothetical protein V1663_03735 [archaeon]
MSLNNCNYNCVKQLGKKLALIAKVDGYIKDAEECNHPWCADMWRKIKEDEERHVEMLRQAIVGLSKEDKFN